MTILLEWDKIGERTYETGVDRGVLYLPDETGEYDTGVAWNGLVSVSESPSGAESTKQYADNMVYLNLVSVEEFACSIEAFTYPAEFAKCDGSAEPEDGVYIGQQPRSTFGLSYRTKVGTDTNPDKGYKIHLVYGALAAPTDKAYNTVNDSPEAATFSWEISTTPVAVQGHPTLKPTASIVIDSTKVGAEELAELEELLYGVKGEAPAADVAPSLPLPHEVLAIFA